MSEPATSKRDREIFDEITVSGYVRQIERTAFHCEQVMPKEIVRIVFDFYHLPRDTFDDKLHSQCVNINGDILLLRVDEYVNMNMLGLAHGFLTNIISKGQHHWAFKLNQFDEEGFIYIGIMNDELDPLSYLDSWPQNLKASDGKPAYYGLNISCGKLRGGNIEPGTENETVTAYYEEIGVGDVIHMYLNMDDFEVCFGFNDVKFDKAFDIEPGSYRADICADADEYDQEIELICYD